METIQHFWESFIEQHSEYQNTQIPIHYYFCDNKKDADACVELVIKGIKQATSSSLWWYKKYNEPLPKIDDLAIVTNWEGVPKVITRVTKVSKVKLGEIDEAYAFKEGEGDKSLAYWHKVHWQYYAREMEPFGEKPSEDMIIVCEEFETIYKLSN